MNDFHSGLSLPLSKERIRKRRMRRLRDNIKSYVFLLPFIVGALVFTAYPIIMSLLFSFSDWTGGGATKMGAFNYIKLFTRGATGEFDRMFHSFFITFVFTIASTVVNLVLSYILALFLHNKIKGMRIIRVLCYLPCLIPGLAGLYLWKDVFLYATPPELHPYQGLGLFNVWLKKAGLPTATFFGDASTAMLTLIISGLWNLGGGMIMWIAAFENISPEYYEAAKIDGAGYMRRLFAITLPLSTPILFYNLVVSMIAGLQTFGTMAAHGVGPTDKHGRASLNFVAVHIYLTAFGTDSAQGLACAMSWLLFVVIALLSLVMFKTGGWVQYGDD